jgi:hypothetical protein
MELSSEERKKIYEEEKAKIEVVQPKNKGNLKYRGDGEESTRTQRITYSSIAIGWYIVLCIVFVWFRNYLAFYQIEQNNGVTAWVRHDILTAGFNSWLPILITTLILSIIGHVLIIIYDKYVVQQSITLAINILGIGTIAYLFYLFPFDFSTLAEENRLILSSLINIVLAIILGVLSIVTLTNFIKLIVRIATRTLPY